ncbi:hypothetical protein GJ744_008930 [Endocarpon pusillum]|uniref:Protein SMG7 n=1 Tax=Endocarpon pusillum TaxID=364733 RepID=A0A8H7AV89_9EURO|nr:hypothetical protein GJ744_008930 [Endocarpon pusillum]
MTSVLFPNQIAFADKVEKELLTLLALKEPTCAEIDVLIAKYRTACETVLFANLAAAAESTEPRLWNAHGMINSKYRSRLASFRDEGGKNGSVERRKLEKRYLDFIKSSMRFYRGHIQRLASHFEGPKEVLEVAYKLHLDTLSADSIIVPAQQEIQLILESCHATLVRLGDLSRYRETELNTRERNWAPAVGYYDLATAIKPSSGASHNQLAVIARADGSHLRTLYHLYRALSVEFPYPRALKNLEIELRKIPDRKNKNQLFPQLPEQHPSIVLQALFVCLHAKLHAGIHFSEHIDLENEVLATLSVELKDRSLNGVLNKMVLSNVAAQHLASLQAAVPAQRGLSAQALTFFVRLNLKTFLTLLRILLQELEQVTVDDDDLGDGSLPNDTSGKLSTAARRILPCLRQYSSWLVSNASHLVGLADHESMRVQIKEFWRVYADGLTLLASTFHKPNLPDLHYLLEEDEDTIAFTPFINPETSRRYYQADGVTRRPRSHDEGVQRHHPSVEMLFRIRGLLEDAISLATKKDDGNGVSVPLMVIDDMRFKFTGKELPLQPTYHKSHSHPHSSLIINRGDVERAKQKSKPVPNPNAHLEDASQSIIPCESVSMLKHPIVDNVIASEVSTHQEPGSAFPRVSHGEPPRTPTAKRSSSADGFYGLPASTSALTEPHETMRPSFPSMMNSPFAPRPGEAPSPQSPPSTAAHGHLQSPASSTPNTLQSSNTRFQASLLRQQAELEMQPQSSIYDLPTTSLSQPPSSPGKNPRFGLGRDMSPFLSPFASSPSVVPEAAMFPTYDVPRPVPEQSRFGAVGQTPPSGQGG